jgi:uncharacterized protein
MAQFKIKLIAPDNTERELHYDNQTSSLTWGADGFGSPVLEVNPKKFQDATVVSTPQPGRKGLIKTLKISLGLSCNYECNYCSQRFVPHAESTNPEDVDDFLQQLTASLSQAPERIEFWGGEPLVYIKTLKPLAERLRVLYPDAEFLIITNGSLLSLETNEWLDRMGFVVGLSHDGPGYHARGADPLDEPDKRAAIMDLYARLHPQGRISINAMISSQNTSRAAVQLWLQERFGADVQIGEGAFIDPYDEGGLAATFKTTAEHAQFRRQGFGELRTGLASRFDLTNQKIQDFIDSIRYQRPASALGQKCGMDRSHNLAVDLKGNVVTCQNVSAAATAPNGQSHLIGQLSDLPAVRMKSATHWSQRQGCSSCPVLQMCKGSCMFLEGPLWDAGCDAAYSDNLVFFAAAIEFLTGCMPVFIDGDLPPERKDIFGLAKSTVESPPVRRVIPILAAQQTA